MFQCDCGGSYEGVIGNVRSQKNPRCKSCRTGSASHAWRGYGELPQDIVNTYRHGAEARGLSFNVSGDFLWDLYLKQERKCALTGWPIAFNATYKDKTKRSASLDRIDSTEGYEPGNVQWVHRLVNRLKRNTPEEDFVAMCTAIAEHRAAR